MGDNGPNNCSCLKAVIVLAFCILRTSTPVLSSWAEGMLPLVTTETWISWGAQYSDLTAADPRQFEFKHSSSAQSQNQFHHRRVTTS